MPPKPLKIDSLLLDLQNPRIRNASDQRDAMQKILNEQKVLLINLAESIAAKGLNPMDRLLVLRSSREGKFVVLEGNRRVLAAKLLKNPPLVDDLTMPEAFRKRLRKASLSFRPERIEPIDCFEVVDREQGIDWIMQRHRGEDQGRGIVGWSSEAISRFLGRDPALQAYDFVLENGALSEPQLEKVRNKFPLTTLRRLLATPNVREAFGFTIEDGKLVTKLPPSEAIKPLRRMVLDLVEDRKNFNVSSLKSKEQQVAYVNRFAVGDRPNLSLTTGKDFAVDEMSERDFVPTQTASPQKKRTARPAPRNSVIPKSCHLAISNPKISSIYDELRSLQLIKHVHAISVLLRVFLEMSVDEYLVAKAGSTLTFPDPNSGRKLDKKLKNKVRETMDHLITIGVDEREMKGIWMAVNDPLNPFSIDTLHAYIHNRFFTPTDAHLTTGWDNAQPFFEKIWN